MSSYLVKIIVFFTILYTLLIPSTIINAFAEGNVNHEKTDISRIDNVGTQVNESSKKFLTPNINKKTGIQNTNNTPEHELPDYIARNLQAAGSLLSSSPSELAEQAKSYVLSKVNSTIASEAQKWLSQSSTAKINFGFDRKGRLENNSVDLLLPIYDNKADWLFFSQLGYRNKDSRNTVNFGLGGRYFSQNWMYGLNTFYDYDITGKNRRVGLGGEIWGDYIKFSTNAYHRLSDWQISRNFEEHHERPANGFDINGEFFLSAYPNLGGKFSYEQYFGDNVTLFNRKTKQKNPSLAKMGVTYTPIPLITMGVDYKQGEGGQSETQFLTNFNLRLGVPLSTQLSPDNVASMRTLAGSRYDLVERNYNIVLDHQKKQNLQLSLPGEIVGYSHEQQTVTAKFSDSSIKKVEWISNGAFADNKGQLSDNKDHTATITFPKYSPDGNNNYPILAVGMLENDQKLPPVQMHVIVRPFVVKKVEAGTPYITPTGPLSASGKDKDAYTITPVITFDTPVGAPVKNATIDDVKWITEPPADDTSGLKLSWEKPKTTKTDENGKLQAVTLTSTQPHQNVKIYLQMGDADKEKQLVGTVNFTDNTQSYKIEKIEITPDQDLTADGEQAYTYEALIVDNEKNPAINKKLSEVKWNIDNPVDGLTLHVPKGEIQTDSEGKLKATLTSNKKAVGIWISLAIEKQPPVKAPRAVSFKLEGISVQPDSAKPKPVHDTYTYTAMITNAEGKAEVGKTVQWGLLENVQGVTLSPVTAVTGPDGKVTTRLTSSVPASNIIVTASSGGNTEKAQQPANFAWPIIHKPIFTPKSGDVSNDGSDAYTYTAIVYEPDGTTIYTGQKIKFEWRLQQPTGDKTTYLKTSGEVTTSSKGELTNNLVSSHNPPIKDAVVCVAIAGNRASENGQQCADRVSFAEAYTLTLTVIRPASTLEGKANKYTFIATTKRKKDNQVQSDVPINWSTSLPVPLAQEPNLMTKQENTTNSQGQATFTMYSKNGGFDNITVTAAADNSSPASKSETVKITAKPKDDDNRIILRNYGGHGIATNLDGVLARNLTFGWDKLTFIPNHNPDNPETVDADGYPAHYSNNKDIIAVVTNDTGNGYFEVKAAGSTTIESRYTFSSGRYLVYQTNIAIDKMIFADTGGSTGNAVAYAYPPDRQSSPAKRCTTGTPVETTDIADSITKLVNQGADLKAAGLIGDIIGIDYVGANTPRYTQAYPLSSSHESDLFILLCYK
ncbi:inverse autotransporter beta domain-containing protein [Xenorhabdus sp. XENO-7]|uniref:Inverse autotransporter beta domain-containing protein n=1 Tax=Xenorhabdus aichiensis TaxID=3025874 RepID=A0ABT5MBM5_9GAMM|nr:inverse autotransporter beta domain-containing protein [Xenorhabdus aichiensis]MDC9623637.1 inverse autotransporter beta domain-containing protein [Xenorhabdus aichiensis]